MIPPDLDVSYIPRFVPAAAEILERAHSELPWDRRMTARQTASSGLAYNYSGIEYPDVPMPTFVSELAARIVEVVGHPIANCLANLYETGESRMGFHSDSAAGVAPDTSTAIVSLGARRALTFRAKTPDEHRYTIELESGSLLVMRAGVQELFLHALLPSPGSALRISLTFRHILRDASG